MTNWFKENPFTAGLAAGTSVLALAALYFAYTQNAALVEQTDAFAANTSTLGRLQSSKPFPNEANLKAAEEESKLAERLLGELASQVARLSTPLDPNITPRDFQDTLSSAVAASEAAATAANVTLPEDFYLGFSAYKAEPPSEEAAPALAQQLEAITNMTGILVKSGVRQVVGIERALLPAEGKSGGEESKPPASDAAEVGLVPFNVEFVADPSAFRSALGAIITAEPMVVVRLVSVVNSSPSPPSKEAAASPEGMAPAGTSEETPEIPVVFGKETLNVKLQLASVSAGQTETKTE